MRKWYVTKDDEICLSTVTFDITHNALRCRDGEKAYLSYMQVRLMRLMSKTEYFIVPKGMKFIESGKSE